MGNIHGNQVGEVLPYQFESEAEEMQAISAMMNVMGTKTASCLPQMRKSITSSKKRMISAAKL